MICIYVCTHACMCEYVWVYECMHVYVHVIVSPSCQCLAILPTCESPADSQWTPAMPTCLLACLSAASLRPTRISAFFLPSVNTSVRHPSLSSTPPCPFISCFVLCAQASWNRSAQHQASGVAVPEGSWKRGRRGLAGRRKRRRRWRRDK